MKKKYAFLDRDGTLIHEPTDTFQIDSLDKLKILDGVIVGLQKLIALGFKLVMISNQDGLGTASFPQKDFEVPQERMLEIFRENGIRFDKIFICPHFPKENCACRKPKLGLLDEKFRASIDLERSLMYGDRETDRLFALNLGIKFVQVPTNGHFPKIGTDYATYVRNLPAGGLGGEDCTDFGRDLRRASLKSLKKILAASEKK
jgi:imidazoleglycerol-phosphate dehydratase/histidinol-phosphatase